MTMKVINLIPADIRRAAARRIRLGRWAVIVALAGVIAAVPYSLSLSRTAQVARLREEFDRLDQDVTSARSRLRLSTSRAQQLLSELERSRAFRSKRAWSGMFALIADCLPEDCWLQSVATDPEAPGVAAVRAPTSPAAPGAAPVRETVTIEAPQKIRLVGFSTGDSQPLVFVRSLTQSGAFARVALQRAMRAPAGKETGEESLYQFEIVCEW